MWNLTGLIVGALSAIALVGYVWWQADTIKDLRNELAIKTASISALENARKEDAKQAREYSIALQKARKENAEFQARILRLSTDPDVASFLNTPVPDSLRHELRDYLNGKFKAPANHE